MSAATAYMGITVDHLYADCPNLRQQIERGSTPCCRAHAHMLGRALGLVDPEGTDLCRRCQRKWKAARKREALSDPEEQIER